MAYTFNGTTKRITLSSGMVTLDLIDLHSRWKDWVGEGNAQHAQALRAVGGDIPAIPLYLFLLNGWRIVPQSADHTLTVTNGIFEVDGGGDPFVDPAGDFAIRINRATPGIAIGYSTTGGGGSTPAEIWSYGSRTLTDAFPDVPTANENATATLVAMIDGGLTLRDVLRIVLSVTAGDATGLEGSAMAFKSADGSKNRIEATYSSGARTITTLDAT